MAKILLLEDDQNLNKGIKIALEKDDHTVVAAHNFFEGVTAYCKEQFDLFLLDINLPDGNGLQLCQRIREKEATPIIFLTAKDTEEEMLQGFTAGCDDYIAKPFSIEVLRRKVGIVLRNREAKAGKSTFTYKDLTVDFDRMTVCRGETECRLTATEYKLLEYLIKNKGRVLTRDMILSFIFDADGNFVDNNTLNVYIKRLRQKVESDPKNPEYIVTVFGIGYTFGE